MRAPLAGRPLRALAQIAVDGAAWVVGLVLADVMRYDLDASHLWSTGLLAVAAVAIGCQYAFGMFGHLYRGRYRFGSFEEVLGVALATGASTLALAVLNLLQPGERLVPRSVPFAGGLVAFTAMAGVRYTVRLLREHRGRAGHRDRHGDIEPLLLFGAGEGADQLLVAMLRDPTTRYLPVGLLDDDVSKRYLRLRGVPVLGGRDAIVTAARQTGAQSLLVAIPSADSTLVREISALAEAAGLVVKVVPTVDQLMGGTVAVGDIRDLDLADLLGRRQIDLDLDLIAGYLTDRRVLVTGAGGSIGSELCRQIARYAPAELIMLDRDESALHAVQLSLTGRALLDGEDLVLADIRDGEQVSRIFRERRPQVVFHAAALKHLTLLERFPGEAVKSNVWGTLNVLEAAKMAGVERFVNISTDKAADPISVLGYSKRIAERLTAHVALAADGLFLSVRFGNVLGSRGSVLTAFQAQVAAGGPVTVTHPDVTRYFMTVQEAVQLVIQAAAVGGDGEVLVLDMGEPVRIADVARRLATRSGRSVEIVFTGLRRGEKLHEDLLAVDEVDARPNHPLLSQVPGCASEPIAALLLDHQQDAELIIESLRGLAVAESAVLVENC